MIQRALYNAALFALLLASGLGLAVSQPGIADEGGTPVRLPSQDVIEPRTGEPVDVAPFGETMTWDSGRDIGILWEDARDIAKVVVRFADGAKLPDPGSVKLQYWLTAGWPGTRIPRDKEAFAGVSGWQDAGDWYNGEWRDADVELSADGSTWTCTFRPANAKEFTDKGDFAATYRTTPKIRLLFPVEAPTVSSLHAFTDSTWDGVGATVLWGKGQEWNGTVEGFNAHVSNVEPAEHGIALTIWYAKPPGAMSFDEPVVTVRSKPSSFSFAPRDIAGGRRVFIRDYGVLVKPAGDETTYAEAEDAYQKASKCRYDQVGGLPEQTLERAWSDMPRKRRIYMPLAVEGGRQHFAMQPDGKLLGDSITFSLGMPESEVSGAHLEDGYMPIPTTWYEKDGVRFSEEAFATTLAGKLPKEGRVRAEEPQALMARLRLTNLTRQPKKVTLPISVGEEAEGSIVERDGLICRKTAEGEQPQLCLNARGVGTLTVRDGRVLCEVELPAGQARDISASISYETLDTPAEIEQLKKLDYDQQHKLIVGYWRKRLAQSCRVKTPEPFINSFLAANPSHQLINTENEARTDERAMARVGTFSYGVYTNESVMMLTDLDRRGYHDIARKAYESWIHYQGSVGLPGDYTTRDGLFYGANGYEAGGYNQHHGWALWGMAEHYWFTRDNAWLDRVAPNLVKGCDWIIGQRRRTMELTGIRAIERGLLPPGSLEDVGDWRCWMSNNVMSCWGMQNVARALAERGHPEGRRLLKEAADYRSDIRAAFLEAMTRTPVARLRDGSYVPIVPSEVHRRGRSLGWITETLEGSIHMIRCGIVDPEEPVAQWIMKDYEDNRYLAAQFGYAVPFEERNWFSLGGFCQQPSLLCSPTPYIMRDEPKHYLRAYFNAFAAGYFPERAMITEHPLPNLGDYAGDHFKSSDEAMNSSWVRWMFIWDEGDSLYLGKVMPRYWLRDGEEVSIERAQTHFGPMGMTIKSRAAGGSIEMTIDPPIRSKPRAIYARFRHPEGKTMNRVTVNGKPWSEFDPAKEWVVLPALTQKTAVTVFYD